MEEDRIARWFIQTFYTTNKRLLGKLIWNTTYLKGQESQVSNQNEPRVMNLPTNNCIDLIINHR